MAMMPISFSMARGSRVFLKGRCQLSAALKAMSTVSKGKRRMASASPFRSPATAQYFLRASSPPSTRAKPVPGGSSSTRSVKSSQVSAFGTVATGIDGLG